MELNTIDAFDPDSPSAKGELPKLWWGKNLKPKGVYAVPEPKSKSSLAELVDTLEKLCEQKKSKATAISMDTNFMETSGLKESVAEVLREMEVKSSPNRQ